jgi:hypothetical protein
VRSLMTEVLGLERQRATGWTLGRVLQNILWEVESGDTMWHTDPTELSRTLYPGRRPPVYNLVTVRHLGDRSTPRLEAALAPAGSSPPCIRWCPHETDSGSAPSGRLLAAASRRRACAGAGHRPDRGHVPWPRRIPTHHPTHCHRQPADPWPLHVRGGLTGYLRYRVTRHGRIVPPWITHQRQRQRR